jgi:hypothetical protein
MINNDNIRYKRPLTLGRLDLLIELSSIDYELQLHRLYGSCPLSAANCHEQLIYRKNEIKKLLGDKK